MTVLDTREHVSALRELVEAGREVSMPVVGSSMAPFLIHGRDLFFFRKPDRDLRVGDMVFFCRDSGQYVMHRIIRIQEEGYFLVGDAQREIEGPIRREQIFGLVTRVKRKGKMIQPGDFWWEFFAHAWLRLLPARSSIAAIYETCRRAGTGRRG